MAGPDALSAENTFVAVKYYKRVAGVDGVFQGGFVETPVIEFKMLMGSDVLQLANFIFYASCAVQYMVAQQQVKRCLAHSSYTWTVKCNR